MKTFNDKLGLLLKGDALVGDDDLVTQLEKAGHHRTNPLHNKSGELSSYGFACGYIESHWNKDLFREAKLYQDCTYQVEVTQIVSDTDFRVFASAWKSYQKLTTARKAYRFCKQWANNKITLDQLKEKLTQLWENE